MSIVARAFEVHHPEEHASLPRKTAGLKFLLEPPFVLLGVALSWLVGLFPAEWFISFHDRVFRALAKPGGYPFDAASPALGRSRELLRLVEAGQARPAALLALISHPPVSGEMRHMNLELVRHAMLALREVRGRPCRPRLVVAVDPFALDTLAVYEEGFYAGFMGSFHLGLDRQASRRGALSRPLLRQAHWSRMPPRLLGLLRRGGEAGMILSGGIPETGRLLYAAREWVGRMRAQSPLRGVPSEILRRARVLPEFKRFEEGSPLGESLRHSPARLLEAWVMEALSGVSGEGEPSAETGRLSEPAKRVLRHCLTALDIPRERWEGSLKALSEKFARETPYRFRLFRALAGRVLAAGRPLVFLPVVHRIEDGLGIEVKDAWAWTRLEGGRVRFAVAGSGLLEEEDGVEEFAERFVRANFP